MNSSTTKRHWHAVYVRMHHEKKVQQRLTAQGIQSFLPIHTEIRQWSDRKKKVDKVLIPMMLFVYVNKEEKLHVLQTPSVMHYMVLRGEQKPAVIPPNQMEQFRLMVEKSDTAVNFQACNLQLGNQVRVTHGPLTGLIGKLVTINGKSSIAIRIDRVGCATVQMDVAFVETVSTIK